MDKKAVEFLLYGVFIGFMGFAAYLNHTVGSREEIMAGIQCVNEKGS